MHLPPESVALHGKQKQPLLRYGPLDLPRTPRVNGSVFINRGSLHDRVMDISTCDGSFPVPACRKFRHLDLCGPPELFTNWNNGGKLRHHEAGNGPRTQARTQHKGVNLRRPSAGDVGVCLVTKVKPASTNVYFCSTALTGCIWYAVTIKLYKKSNTNSKRPCGKRLRTSKILGFLLQYSAAPRDVILPSKRKKQEVTPVVSFEGCVTDAAASDALHFQQTVPRPSQKETPTGNTNIPATPQEIVKTTLSGRQLVGLTSFVLSCRWAKICNCNFTRKTWPPRRWLTFSELGRALIASS